MAINYRKLLNPKKTTPITLTPFDREKHLTFGTGDGMMKYQKRTEEEKRKAPIYFGQAKLGFMLLQFINTFYDPVEHEDAIILYIGAAPGINIAVVAKMYPMITFELYDSSVFSDLVNECKNINVHNKLFEEGDVEIWKKKREEGKNIFLVSDIRNTDYKIYFTPTREEQTRNDNLVTVDMRLQENWVINIDPIYASLKFRLPWYEDWSPQGSEIFNYLDGLVMPQVFESPTSSETRLVTFKSSDGVYKKRNWSTILYQDTCSYHNKITRTSVKFENILHSIDTKIELNSPIAIELGLNNDFDSTISSVIILDYLEKFNINPTYKSFYVIAKTLFDSFGKGIFWNYNLAGKRKNEKFAKEDGSILDQNRKQNGIESEE